MNILLKRCCISQEIPEDLRRLWTILELVNGTNNLDKKIAKKGNMPAKKDRKREGSSELPERTALLIGLNCVSSRVETPGSSRL